MIEICELQKMYPDFTLNISLNVKKGCVIGLVGRNGAGKSTTIKSILDLIVKDGGSVKVFGKDAHNLSVSDKENMGVALAESSFSIYLTINSIIKILDKMYPKFNKSYFIEMCNKQGLPLNKQVKDFSTGMKAKLRVLATLSHDADLLILDEPTAGLDVVARNEVLDMLREYMEKDENRSILITSHISSDLEGICDEIYMIHDGKVILHEDTDVLLGNYGVLKVRDEQYESLDKTYLLNIKKETFGYVCLTNEKQYYIDNYPEIVIENSSIDDLIMMLTGGNR